MSEYAAAKQALRGACQIRKKIGVSFDDPLAMVDVALQLDIHVSFLDISTMEGMWCKEKRAIVLTSLRPPGRRNFTCAHEVAHFHFNHGTTIDEMLGNSLDNANSPEEKLANQLAGYLLVPQSAVFIAMNQRKLNEQTLSVEQVYTLACFFGVSYMGLLSHLCFTLRVIPRDVFDRLKKTFTKINSSKALPWE